MLKPRHLRPLIALAIAVLFLTGWSGAALAQSQSNSAPSVAEAARRAREKKNNAAKPVRTLTNEDLPAAPVAESNNGNAQPSPATSPDGAALTTTDGRVAPTAPVSDEQSKRKMAENVAALERAKKELIQAQSELDVMQRKAALDSESYYSKPDFASDKDGKASLDAEAQEINDKKQAVDKMKARVIELQVLVGEPVPTEPAKNPPPPQ
jgi:hypothetical protein